MDGVRMAPADVTPELARYCYANWDTIPLCKAVPLFGYCILNAQNDPEFCNPDLLGNYYGYRLDFAAYVAFLALFAASLVAFVLTYAFTRRGLAFGVAYALGCVAEVLGYAGRVISSKNQWNENGFLIQICCLTFGPAFMAAGNYLCLRRIVYAFGKENSRIAPEWYTRVFIPCDLLSLVLQALGGGMASVASHNNGNVEPGNNIMIAGLSFQVFTLLAFIILSGDFAWRTYSRYRRLGAAALDQAEATRRTRSSWLFKGFLAALALSTICIFWRSVFRVAELSKGWDGPVMKRQDLFIGFEGVMVVIACYSLNIFHPAFCFREMLDNDEGGLGGCCGRTRKSRAAQAAAIEAGTPKSAQGSGDETEK